MSRMYRANVNIENSVPKREKEIAQALLDFWGFDDVVSTPDGLESSTDNCLCAGMTEDEFARLLAQRVWAANQGFCEVAVNMIYLEELPSEEYVFDSKDEYEQWLKTSDDKPGTS